MSMEQFVNALIDRLDDDGEDCIHDCDNCPYFEIVDCRCLLFDDDEEE